MKVKSLIYLRFIATLFLSSCTINAGLNEENENKVKELLKNTTDDQEIIIDTSSNAAQNKSSAAKAVALQKQSQPAKDLEFQIPYSSTSSIKENPKSLPGASSTSLANSTNSASRPKTNSASPPTESGKNAKSTKEVTPTRQIASSQIKNGPKGTKNSRKNIRKPQKHVTRYSLDDSNNHTELLGLQDNNSSTMFEQVSLSFAQTASIKSQTLKDNFLRTISEEKTKIKNNTGFRETYDQFKMKDSAFSLLDVISNITVFDRSYAPLLNSNTPEAENERNKFYAVLDFDQSKIEQFGSIMEILYKEDKNHSLIRSLIISGLGIQISFELALEELEKKIEILTEEHVKNRIGGFDFETKIKDLQLIFNTILTEKKEWSKQVDALIANASSNASSNASLKDSGFLAQYIQAKYLNKMQNARQSVLDLYISITEFK
ncbi:complement regulator-acquiring protein (plasmid) [Borreliella sinica]|uniref:complement regulator-acquiring protein n=1 Tax=Borreliella sinica TaxID=87162 RepID=UPI002A2402A5|nr:complement regulator-acquiring protein [Borreliella sinica]WPM06416.1 complement regulator-acquiring protein [Borreliella sinica]